MEFNKDEINVLKSLIDNELMELKELIESADEQDKLSLIKYQQNLESILKKLD